MLFSSNYQIMNSGNLIFNICMSKVHCVLLGDLELKVNTGPTPVPEHLPEGWGHTEPPLCADENPNDLRAPGLKETQALPLQGGGGSGHGHRARHAGGSGPRVERPCQAHAAAQVPRAQGPATHRSGVCGNAVTPSCPPGPQGTLVLVETLSTAATFLDFTMRRGRCTFSPFLTRWGAPPLQAELPTAARGQSTEPSAGSPSPAPAHSPGRGSQELWGGTVPTPASKGLGPGAAGTSQTLCTPPPSEPGLEAGSPPALPRPQGPVMLPVRSGSLGDLIQPFLSITQTRGSFLSALSAVRLRERRCSGWRWRPPGGLPGGGSDSRALGGRWDLAIDRITAGAGKG